MRKPRGTLTIAWLIVLCSVVCSVLAGQGRTIKEGENRQLRGKLEFIEESDYTARLVLENGQTCYLRGPIVDLGNIPKDQEGKTIVVRGDIDSFTDAQGQRCLRMRVREATYH